MVRRAQFVAQHFDVNMVFEARRIDSLTGQIYFLPNLLFVVKFAPPGAARKASFLPPFTRVEIALAGRIPI